MSDSDAELRQHLLTMIDQSAPHLTPDDVIAANRVTATPTVLRAPYRRRRRMSSYAMGAAAMATTICVLVVVLVFGFGVVSTSKPTVITPARPSFVPASWQKVTFGGLTMFAPGDWSVHSDTLWSSCYMGPYPAGFIPGSITLNTGVDIAPPSGCPIDIPKPEPLTGLLIDPGPNGPLLGVNHFGRCFDINGVSVCPVTDNLTTHNRDGVLLAFAVHIPGRAQPVAVEIGLAGGGKVAHTILYSVRGSEPSSETTTPTPATVPPAPLVPGGYADSLATAETTGLHFLFDEWQLGLVDITSVSYVTTDAGTLNRSSDFNSTSSWLNGLRIPDSTSVWVFQAQGEFQLGRDSPCGPPYSAVCGSPFSVITQVMYSNVEGFGPKYGPFAGNPSAPTPDISQLGIVQTLPESVWGRYNRGAPTSPTTTPCTVPQLAITATRSGNQLGYTGTEVVFQNTSGLSCFMDGYLKVWFVDGTSGRLGTVSSDQSGKVSRVIIGPGQSASSTIWAGNPLTLEGNRPCQPEATSGLDVILPGQTVVTFVRVEQPGNLSVCTVSPVNRVWTSPITAGTQEALWGG